MNGAELTGVLTHAVKTLPMYKPVRVVPAGTAPAGITYERQALIRAGDRMAEMLAMAPNSRIEDWPTDQEIMEAVGAWKAALAAHPSAEHRE